MGSRVERKARSSPQPSECSTCINAVYDHIWGEYKCTSLKHVIYKPDEMTGCIYYKKGTPAKSKEDYETIDE